MIGLFEDAAAEPFLQEQAVAALTAAATLSIYYVEGLTDDQIAANRALIERGPSACLQALAASNQFVAVATDSTGLAGYVIATRHQVDDHELDWLMVDSAHHGTGVADALMFAGMRWLGLDKPMWLSVASHNERAIRFYRRFGFAIDQYARTGHVVPHSVMRRLPQ